MAAHTPPRKQARSTVEAAFLRPGDEVHLDHGYRAVVRRVDRITRGLVVEFEHGAERVMAPADPVSITTRKPSPSVLT